MSRPEKRQKPKAAAAGGKKTAGQKGREPRENPNLRYRDRNHRSRPRTGGTGHRGTLRHHTPVRGAASGRLACAHARRAPLDGGARWVGHRPLRRGGQPGVPLGGYRDGPGGDPRPAPGRRKSRRYLRHPHPRGAGAAHPGKPAAAGQSGQRQGGPADTGTGHLARAARAGAGR